MSGAFIVENRNTKLPAKKSRCYKSSFIETFNIFLYRSPHQSSTGLQCRLHHTTAITRSNNNRKWQQAMQELRQRSDKPTNPNDVPVQPVQKEGQKERLFLLYSRGRKSSWRSVRVWLNDMDCVERKVRPGLRKIFGLGFLLGFRKCLGFRVMY